MLGYTHVTMGAAVGVATLPLLGMDADIAVQCGWVAAVSGAALAPDLDHPEAGASRMWGPVSQVASTAISAISGGHRQGTHDVVLAGVTVWLVAWLCGQVPAAFTVLLVVCIGLALRGLLQLGGGLFTGLVNLGIAAWAASAVVASSYADAVRELLPLALVTGIVVHVVGDLVTPEGVPVPALWLWRREARVALPLLSTGSIIERALVAPACTAAVGWLVWTRLGSPDITALGRLVVAAVTRT